MKSRLASPLASVVSFGTAVSLVVAAGCGKTPASTSASGNVTLQSAPLAGPNAAARSNVSQFLLASLLNGFGPGWMPSLLSSTNALAAVSTFKTFKVCNDTLIFLDDKGNQLTVNGSANPSVGQGLLTFSPSATTPMSIGSLNIPAGTVLSEVDITLATVPSVCGGANYAVEFDDGVHGPADITQNTAFKFKFGSSGLSISGSSQSISLLFGQIVNGMVSLGSTLDNSTIQTVNVGQAQ